ncbi:MAG: TolC family protein [Deltaproteobacteria bacterium]|nr:TolC family protein [Deltaproteobacteria bacterium]
MKRLFPLLLLPTLALGRPLTYDEAVEAALRANPSVLQAGSSIDMAEAGVLAARGIFDPAFTARSTLTAASREGFFQGFPYTMDSRSWATKVGMQGSTATGTGYSLSSDLSHDRATYLTSFAEGVESESLQEAYTSNFNLSLSQELLRGFRYAYNAQNLTRARRDLDDAALSAERTRQQARAEAGAAYWTWEGKVMTAHLAQDAHAIAVEALRVGTLQREAGELAPLEQTRLEAAVVQARADLLDAARAEAQSRDALLLLMGEAPAQELLPATPIGALRPADIDAARAVEVAMAQNLDLLLARSAVERAKESASLARHAVLPSLTASGSVGRGAQNFESAPGALRDLLSDEAFPTWTAGATLSAPVGNRAARGARDQSLASLQRSELQLAALERQVRSQVGLAVQSLQSAAERQELAAARVRLAAETLAAEEALADAGRRLLKDALEARRALAAAQADEVTSLAAYRAAQVELARLQGTLGD